MRGTSSLELIDSTEFAVCQLVFIWPARPLLASFEPLSLVYHLEATVFIWYQHLASLPWIHHCQCSSGYILAYANRLPVYRWSVFISSVYLSESEGGNRGRVLFM